MELILFALLLASSVIFLFLTYFSEGENYFFAVTSGILFLILGIVTIAEGFTITHSGAYGFVANNTTAMTGIATYAMTRKDIYTGGIGTLLMAVAIYMFLVPLIERFNRPIDNIGEPAADNNDE